MRLVRMLGLCVVAALAIAVLPAASASALEFGECFSKPGAGLYSNSNCTVKAKPKGTGNFEWKKGSEVGSTKFTGEGGVGVLSIFPRICVGKAEGFIIEGTERTRACEEGGAQQFEELFVECATENATGEQSGKTEVKNVNVVFHGCAALGAIPCTDTGTEGEVQTDPLKGKIGYISKSKHEVGVLLTPVKSKGRFAEFVCGGTLQTGVGVGNPKTEGCVYKESLKCGADGIISPITPVNEMTTKFTQVYAQNTEDENLPTKFEGKPRDSLEAFVADAENPKNSTLWSHGGEVITNVNTVEKAGEIKG